MTMIRMDRLVSVLCMLVLFVLSVDAFLRLPRPQTSRPFLSPTNASSSSSEQSTPDETMLSEAERLQRQAEKLRAEADAMKQSIEEQTDARRQKQLADIDKWIDKLLIKYDDGTTQLLNTVEETVQILVEERFSQEQINKIFNRMCELRHESRSNISPILELLVDSTGRLDCMERRDNPNKRWNHRVERTLRKKLFMLDWGHSIEGDDDKNDGFPRGLF